MLRRWTNTLLVLAGGIVGLIVALAVFVNTGVGQRTVASLVGTLSGDRVSISGLSGRIPYSLRAERVEVRDDDGTWLVVDNVALDWSPFALLWNRVDVASAEAERVAVLRIPADDGEDSGTNPSVDIRALRIARLETTAAASKEPAAVAVQGSVRYASLEEWAGDLTANRLDAEGFYRIRASREDGLLSGTADIQEPPAGLVVGLLGLNDIGAIEAHLTGSGPRDANAVRLTLTAGPLQASGEGTINLVARMAEISFSATAPAMELRTDLAWQSLSAQGQLSGSFDAPDIDASLDVRTLRAQDINIDGVTATITGQTGDLMFDGSIAGLRVPGSDPDVFARDPIAVRGRVDLDLDPRPFSISLLHPLLGIEAQGTAGDMEHAEATVTVPRLAPFAERGGVDLDGRAALTATVDRTGDEIRIAGNGTISTTMSDDPVSRLIGDNARLVVNATVNGSVVAISEVRLDGPSANVRMTGRVTDNDVGLDWSLGLNDLSLLTASLVGDLNAQGQLRGPWQTAQLEATGVANVGTPTIPRQRIDISANATGFPRTERGTFTAQGRFDDAPVSFEGELARMSAGLQAVVDRVTWKSLSARADITVPDDGGVSGNATLRLAQLRDLSSLIGEPVDGNAEAEIDLSSRDGATTAEIMVRAQDVRYADAMLAGLETDATLTTQNNRTSVQVNARASNVALQDAAITRATVMGRVDEPFDSPSLALTLDAAALSAGEFTGNATAQVNGPTNALTIRLDWAPRDATDNPAEITTAARLDLDRQQIVVNALQAKYRGETATLAQPSTLSFGSGIGIDRLLLRVADGQVSASGTLSPRLQLRATAQNVSTTLIAPFVPALGPEGTISANAELSGTLADPQGAMTVEGRGLRARSLPAGMTPASLDARADFRQRRVSLNADLTAGASTRMSVTGDVSLAADRGLDLDIQGQADLSMLNAVLSAEGRSLQGQVSLNASVSGTVSEPRLSGRATLADGEVQDVQRALRIRGISMTAEGTGERIRITDFSARAGDGTISGNGTIDISQAEMPIDVTLTAKGARPFVGDRLTATTDATLRLSGAARGRLLLAGNVDVTRAEITLPEKVPATVVVLDVRRPGMTPGQPMDESTPLFSDLRYDLTVASSGQVFVRGRGIEAELDGALMIAGPSTAPQITGGFELRRGTFTVASRTFDLTRGRVTFDGVGITNRIDPTLDLTAENTSGGISARVTVTGYASAPRIELSSTPTLPQDEILARILFQRSAAQLSGLELAQLAEIAVALASGGSGFDPLGSIRRTLGLSRLSIGSTSTPATTTGTGTAGQATSSTAVEAGTYVLRNVYVGAKQGLSGGTQAEVEVDLTDRLKAFGTVNTGSSAAVTQGSKQQDQGSSVGLSFQFEY
jgi:translocation and assembly module TamB